MKKYAESSLLLYAILKIFIKILKSLCIINNTWARILITTYKVTSLYKTNIKKSEH